MKAWELRGAGLENLVMAQRSEPKPGPGQVRIRVRAASLNYRDLAIALGKYPATRPLPLVPLSDGAGEVVETGPNVAQWRPGDRVIGNFFTHWVDGPLTPAKAGTALGGAIDGVLAEQVVLPADGIVRAPEHLTDAEAAALPCAAVTAWHALFEGTADPLKPGDTVLLEGTGGVAMFGLQFAKAAGARVIVTSSSDAKLERARAAGADAGINYRANPAWHERVKEITGGRGVEHVLELGGEKTLDLALQSVAYAGQVHLIGMLTGSPGAITVSLMARSSVRVRRVYVGSVSMFEAMNRAIGLHRIRPIVDRTFAFDEAPAALKHLQSASHVGKIVLAW